MTPKPKIAIPVPHSDAEYAARALPPYEHAIREAGGDPVVIPLDKSPDDIATLLSGCHAVVLPGSRADVEPSKYDAERHPKTAAADPRRDMADELLLQDAYNLRKPILGICYGMQSLNVWRTGTLRQHLETDVVNHAVGRAQKEAHAVNVEPGSHLATLLSDAPGTTLHPSPDFTALQMNVNSSHHQAVEKVGDGLRIAARSELDRVIEAIEGIDDQHFVLAVQWHPERSFEQDAASRALFHALVEAARARHNTTP